MRGDEQMIEILNEVLTAELVAINQYFLASRMCHNWGIGGLAKAFYDFSIEEMRDAQSLTDRVLYLEGLPNYQRLGEVAIGEDPVETLEAARDLEVRAVERLNSGVALAVDLGDNGSRELLARMLVEEEEHLDWLETQLDLVDRLGRAAYLAEQMHTEA